METPEKPDISAVQDGNRRVEYHRPAPPPLRAVRDGMTGRTLGNVAGYYFGIALGVAWTGVVCSISFSVGVDQGTAIGLTACAAGDSVAVDPAVSGAMP